ncbi:MAG: type II secretion system protein [Deltaproteobacteria bacterium]|nr:type II secretion system protein [Deltaproteobacteria bacterium]
MKHDAYTPAANRGFTLIEIVITIVILGAVAGILVPFFNAIVHSPDPVIRERAISLGQAMMDEIMAKRWDENTPMGGGPICTGESPTLVARPKLIDPTCAITATLQPAPPPAHFIPEEATRQDYDDVDDYDGLSEPVAGKFYDQNGNPFTLPLGYTRTVSVRYISSNANPIDQNTTAASPGTTTDTKRVVVTITSPLGEVFNFVAVACNI